MKAALSEVSQPINSSKPIKSATHQTIAGGLVRSESFYTFQPQNECTPCNIKLIWAQQLTRERGKNSSLPQKPIPPQ